MSPRKTTPENCVLKACKDLLAAERIWFTRMQARTFQVIGAGGRERPMFVGEPGMADLLATPLVKGGTIILWIECKKPKGGKQSDLQKDFEALVRRHGHNYLLVSQPEHLTDWLKWSQAHGL